MRELNFPFDGKDIIRRRLALRKQLLADGCVRVKKRIAVLGGSTTNHIVSALELFLLNFGIEPEFYLSEYNKFYEDAVFGNPELDSFDPDVIYIHTTSRNLTMLPESPAETAETVEQKLNDQFAYFKQVWDSLKQHFSCPVIQNNFELPLFRRTGSYDGWSTAGHAAFIQRMNVMLSDYARSTRGLYIHDINYLSAVCGLANWHDAEAWYLYKYAMSTNVIPDLAYSLACIIKSIYGKNHKVIDLDLDNTLWGGVIGDDGQEGIEIGQETAIGQAFSEFQSFIKGYKDYGVLLALCSKNDEENALLGLNHPCGVLKSTDFVSIKANWEPKDRNIAETAADLSLGLDSFVFIDDNPAECAIIEGQLPMVQTINLSTVHEAMYKLTRSGFFEVTAVSDDDMHRSEMYAANAQRAAQLRSFESYEDYLLSLDMHAVICGFEPVYIQRITQLTNKSNQFNLTTCRYNEDEIQKVSTSPDHICICGRLLDKFGDNGIVSVVIGKCRDKELDIELWLMSCRVLKRDMELAMLDELVRRAKAKGITRINGFYYKTHKNSMVAELYSSFGFTLDKKLDNGDSEWHLDIEGYENKNKVIKIRDKENPE
ncbi:HAD-IIIC family phosphatase [Ruminococcus flavefaciens]|uniref:HAD-superfamily phosphatase, subfamily IIIC/FkbH-like domain-containing protein n=1 Tax=Ruminococcus flavefaciens TaxID=1265 RepID=A0A1K1LNK5_RUMFL|nr:HAD-IIIC family phosphatase [Ruminococcus flavefaciens]SFW12485.1 HAD-superfamily phosphatase, subfamily IIIC/FkbH-like domain-containing protein [Ruminococcus flavefaciens]